MDQAGLNARAAMALAKLSENQLVYREVDLRMKISRTEDGEWVAQVWNDAAESSMGCPGRSPQQAVWRLALALITRPNERSCLRKWLDIRDDEMEQFALDMPITPRVSSPGGNTTT